MPICGYIVYPVPGKSNELRLALAATPGCEVRPAENDDLLILVTDTPDDERETELQETLQTMPAIRCLAMTFGAMDGAVPGAAEGGAS